MMTVVIIGEMNRRGLDEKSVMECDQDEAYGMKQEVDSKDRMMHIEIGDL